MMRDFFFQIVLGLIGIVIGVTSPILQKKKQKIIALCSGVLLFIVAILWIGYEWGRRETSSVVFIETLTPPPTSTLTPPLTFTTTPQPSPLPILTNTPTNDYKIFDQFDDEVPPATETPLINLIVKETLSPVVTPIHVGQDLQNDCISADFWTPYKGEAHSIDENGCWQLANWGMSAQNGGLLLFLVNSSSDQWHGIYTPLPKDTDIQFKVKIDKLQTIKARNGNIAFGIVNAGSPPQGSRFLFYSVISADSPIFISSGDWGLNNSVVIQQYNIGEIHQILFSIRGIVLNISINGDQVAGPISLADNQQPALWIGYSVPETSNLLASILELSIVEK